MYWWHTSTDHNELFNTLIMVYAMANVYAPSLPIVLFLVLCSSTQLCPLLRVRRRNFVFICLIIGLVILRCSPITLQVMYVSYAHALVLYCLYHALFFAIFSALYLFASVNTQTIIVLCQCKCTLCMNCSLVCIFLFGLEHADVALDKLYFVQNCLF